MATTNDELLKMALSLPPGDRARLAEQLLESLETSDDRNRQLWFEEAERRVEAHERGNLEAVSGTDVIQKAMTHILTSGKPMRN